MTTQAVEVGLLALQAVEVAFLLLHDWVPLGRLSNLPAVRAVDPPRKLLLDTLISSLPFVLVFAVCCACGTSPWPGWLFDLHQTPETQILHYVPALEK